MKKSPQGKAIPSTPHTDDCFKAGRNGAGDIICPSHTVCCRRSWSSNQTPASQIRTPVLCSRTPPRPEAAWSAGHSEGERGSGCKTGTPGVRSRDSRRDPAMSGRAELTPSCLEAEGSRLFLYKNAEPGLPPLYVPARPPRQGKNELSVPSWLSLRSRAGQARVRASRGCCGCQGPGRKVQGSASTTGPPSSGVKAALGDLPEARPATVARPPSAQTYRGSRMHGHLHLGRRRTSVGRAQPSGKPSALPAERRGFRA